jgi:hypothetical protein
MDVQQLLLLMILGCESYEQYLSTHYSWGQLWNVHFPGTCTLWYFNIAFENGLYIIYVIHIIHRQPS